MDEFRYERISESDAELREVFSGRGQIVTEVGNSVFQVHDDLGDVRALVANIVEVQPGYLDHGLESRLAGQLQVLHQQLDAVADHLVEQVLLWSEVYLLSEGRSDFLLELLFQMDGGLEAVLRGGDDAGDLGDLLLCIPRVEENIN